MNPFTIGVLASVLFLLAADSPAESSAEAILQGLKKAEARLRGADPSPSYRCELPGTGLIRTISVAYPAPETGYVCKVLFATEKGLKIPWNARRQREYCQPRMMELLEKHQQRGWSCTKR